jgi:collagen beta-1,O-galactosyltransferase
MTSFQFKYSTYRTKDDGLFDNIYSRKSLGCFRATEVFDCYLVNLNATGIHESLAIEIDFDKENDDDEEISYIAREMGKFRPKLVNVLIFPRKINFQGVLMHVCNRESFGYVVPINESKAVEKSAFTHINAEHLLNGPNRTYNQPLPISNFIDEKYLSSKKTKMIFDKIFVINLEKRPDRRDRIKATLDLLGLDYNLVKAVDGMNIDDKYLKDLGISDGFD